MYTFTEDPVTGLVIPGVEGARVYLQHSVLQDEIFEVFTDENGEVLLKDLPVGSYSFKVSKSKRDTYVKVMSLLSQIKQNWLMYL